jgi:tRNA modification GTPase
VSDTIFALSSGSPPAAIAILRISGPHAGGALTALAGPLPPARQASQRDLRDRQGVVIDQALVLWFPGPRSATGEDCAELHCHGGRAVIAALERELALMPGLRQAQPGEFTRRAFANGRIDLAQAEALGDLLAAETELQRRAAHSGRGGALSREAGRWRAEVLALSAELEAILDFSDEDDVRGLGGDFFARRDALRKQIAAKLALPRAERLREGIRVVLAGPPNSGKSSLFNAIVGEGAAIVTPLPGTTRDVIERPVALAGVPFVLVDTAGLRTEGAGDIEAMGIARAHEEVARADIVLWLGEEGHGPCGAIEVQSRCDDPAAPRKARPAHVVSSVTLTGLSELVDGLVTRAQDLLPAPGVAVVNARQALHLREAETALATSAEDPLIVAETLREARVAFDRLLGFAGVEEMLDAVFARFCIGK